jgi:membrane protease YdiL (CAAX protease family)
MKNNENIKQMNLIQIILYHLVPGILILLLAILFSNPDWGFGLPILLAIIVAATIGLIPVQLLIIALTAKRQRLRFKDMLPYTQKTPIGKFMLWAVPCFLFALLIFGFFSNIEYSLWEGFIFMPDWLRLDKYTMDAWSIGILRVTAVTNFLVVGFFGPIVEEVYFRGFLLPRMNKLGKSAPLVNAALFSIYHFFSPWELITRVLGGAPFAYAVWHKKDIRISIAVHCSLNLIGCVSMMIAVLQM